MVRNSLCLVLTLASVTSLACLLSAGQRTIQAGKWEIPAKGGLVRTNLDNWEARKFEYCGFWAEIPVDVYYAPDAPNDTGILMHPVWPPPGVIDEPRCILEVTFIRSDDERRRFDEGTAAMKKGDPFWDWYFKEHNEISRFDHDDYSSFRLDVPCENGDLLRISASVRNVLEDGQPIYLEEDEKAIRRLLSSVRCIDPLPPPARDPKD